jgi:DNA primase
LKLLQSEGRLSLISTTREKGTGRLVTQRYEVRGPVVLMLTTTAADLDPELMNRCLVITVDESELQTAAILAQQRFARTFPGFQQKRQAMAIARLHQNAQRLLKPLQVHNPFASQLTFAGAQTRFRRDHEKYLTLIHTICLLHQYQRETKTCEVDGQEVSYLEVTRSDIAAANRIAQWALGRSIDELPGPTRRLLGQLCDWTGAESKQQRVSPSEFTFTRRQAREALRWNATHFREHLERLVQAEYVVPHGRGQGKLHRYSLLYRGCEQDSRQSLLGLIEADALIDPTPDTTTATWHPPKPLGINLALGSKGT